jgi:AraC family transcriptional regulator, regulatory protein of adaptative response / methylated-DNA-[protein]-cysteine methyltransferase
MPSLQHPDMMWQAVLSRDARADGLFVYAVTSTGVYCRPSCPSRRPGRERVEFFPAGAMAESRGFRACRRCRPDVLAPRSARSERVRRACEAIASTPDARWPVARIARAAGASVPQIQRAFRARLGLGPRDYAAACRRRRFLTELRLGQRVTDAVYVAGYSSSGRAYGGLNLPGMTPATYGRGGAGAVIGWMTVTSPLGLILVAATARGLCFVEIGADLDTLLAGLRREFPKARINGKPARALKSMADAARTVASAKPFSDDLPVDIQGTAFQWRVWRALTTIPAGETRSYAELAAALGMPSAARAVGRACGANPLALVVPCHRVLPQGGGVGGYRWGPRVKRDLLDAERAAAGRQRSGP